MKTQTFTKAFIFFIGIGFGSHASAQTRALMGLVKAENDFAALAASANTRDAFLANVNDSSLVFSNGKVLKGKQVWTDRKANTTLLSWQPAFADISGGGDFGYTTGPWQFKKDRADEKPVAYGDYNTVWIKDDSGDWKVFLDMGVSHPAPTATEVLKTSATRPVRLTESSEQSTVTALEQKLIQSLNGKGNAHKLLPFLSEESRVAREEKLPLTNKDSIRAFLNASPMQSFGYTMVGLKTAPAQDMAVAYGKVIIDTDANQPVFANYMRVWKKEKAGWKVVLDVLSL